MTTALKKIWGSLFGKGVPEKKSEPAAREYVAGKRVFRAWEIIQSPVEVPLADMMLRELVKAGAPISFKEPLEFETQFEVLPGWVLVRDENKNTGEICFSWRREEESRWPEGMRVHEHTDKTFYGSIGVNQPLTLGVELADYGPSCWYCVIIEQGSLRRFLTLTIGMDTAPTIEDAVRLAIERARKEMNAR